MTEQDLHTAAKVLIADDQPDVLQALCLLCKPEGYQVQTAASPDAVVEAVSKADFDLVLIDLNYARGHTSGQEGLDLLLRIQQIDSILPVVIMTAWSSVELAVEAMRRGARDFVSKPWKNERLLTVMRTQIELSRALRQQRQLEQENILLRDETHRPLIGKSPAFQHVRDTIARIGPSTANVLITGENGSGKGVIAQALHEASPRKDRAMVTLNTSSIPESVFESELFGHVAGAFTDAKSDRLGRFKLADNGTLFLDEIATIPVNLQSKLLRVLESGEFEPVGSSKTCRVDARILSATNANLNEDIAKGNFRQDLLYRLNTVEIRVPPLRERREDISLLAFHFLGEHVVKYRKAITGFDAASLQVLTDYPWPGNVRELDHTVERAVLMTHSDTIHPSDLGLQSSGNIESQLEDMTLEEIERRAIRKTLIRFNGDVSKAATALGLSRGALYRRLEKYGIG
ncbi:MAG: sigma-54-dependent Fis family transcriptional regulator [Phycisphaerae bacterium]|nr:sigma-54-dependent Fis family transcriptional regulator [Phycisphaerae bacterium]